MKVLAHNANITERTTYFQFLAPINVASFHVLGI